MNDDGILYYDLNRCAFKNTPKYNEVAVLGKGKIVKRNWVTECFAQKKRFPWRRYALDPKETSQPDSEDEIHDLASKPVGRISFGTSANDDGKQTNECLYHELTHRELLAIYFQNQPTKMC